MNDKTTRRIRTRGSSATVLMTCVAGLWFNGISAAQSPNNWQDMAPMPQARFETACAVIDDVLYLFGGYSQGVRASNRVVVFDPAKNEWRRLKDMPSALTHINTVVDGRTVWLAGGFKDGYPGKVVDEVWQYDVDTEEFLSGPPLPEPRAGGGLALVGRTLHYLGGLQADRDTDCADHWTLELDATGDAARWENAAPMPRPRNQFGTVTYNGKIYAIGGQFRHDSTMNKAALDQPLVDIYDPETDRWSSGPELPIPHSHAEPSTFVHDGKIFVVGGRSVSPLQSVIFQFDGSQWTEIGHIPGPRLAPAARIINGRLVVAGGAVTAEGGSVGLQPNPAVWSRSK